MAVDHPWYICAMSIAPIGNDSQIAILGNMVRTEFSQASDTLVRSHTMQSNVCETAGLYALALLTLTGIR